jgi:hypothetical protein
MNCLGHESVPRAETPDDRSKTFMRVRHCLKARKALFPD